MVSINARNVAINIHTESIRGHSAVELKKHKVYKIFNTDGCIIVNRLLINGIHHKRFNHEMIPANGEARINGLDSCRGYGKRRL